MADNSFIQNINKIADKSEEVEIVGKAIDKIDNVAKEFKEVFDLQMEETLSSVSQQVDDALEVLYVDIVTSNGTVFKNNTTTCKTLTANLFIANLLQADDTHEDYRYIWKRDDKPILVDAYRNMVTVYNSGDDVPADLYFTDDGNVFCRSIIVCNGHVTDTAQFTVELVHIGE